MDENKQHTLCDLVLEGGGVKGVGIVGALKILEEKDFRFCRIAGTSAGALVGALLAAGYTSSELEQLFREISYTAFRDETILSRFGYPGKAASLYFTRGIYRGDFIRDWLAEKLAAKGVRTFSDLRIREDWCETAPYNERYKLVAITADITRGRMVRLPWDYQKYDLRPDDQLVADAVRASISIPFFYKPAKLGRSLLVDGVIVSNFPIDLFESTPKWPTIGVKLSAKPEANLRHLQPIRNPLDFGRNIIATMINSQDQMHLDDIKVLERTIFVDTGDIKPTDFHITKHQKKFLFDNGEKAATKFLRTFKA